jgi:hypothetical protein
VKLLRAVTFEAESPDVKSVDELLTPSVVTSAVQLTLSALKTIVAIPVNFSPNTPVSTKCYTVDKVMFIPQCFVRTIFMFYVVLTPFVVLNVPCYFTPKCYVVK